jgi:serine/threonine protein phosphatase PrpC
MSAHFSSKKGQREQNEDHHNIIVNIKGTDNTLANINFYGIYDGHGGKCVSKFLSKAMPKLLMDKNNNYPLKGGVIKDIYSRVQNKLETKYKKYAAMCGSTCLIALHYKQNKRNIIDVLNTGDSRCIICQDDTVVLKTEDHKPNSKRENERIKKLGGKIYKDQFDDWRIGDLSVSRAFGDLDNKPYISEQPDIYRHILTKEDKFMVLGCDGLWDVLHENEIINFINTFCYDKTGIRIKSENKLDNVANHLANLALGKGSTDNVSVIVVFFK